MKHKNVRYGSLLVTTALVLTPFSAWANEIFYANNGSDNTFTATVSGSDNRIGTDGTDAITSLQNDFNYNTAPTAKSAAVVDIARSYTIETYTESKQIGDGNSATASQTGSSNWLSFTQGSQGGDDFIYSFGASATDGSGGTNTASDFFNDGNQLLSYLAIATINATSGNLNSLTTTQDGDLNKMAIYQLGGSNTVRASQTVDENVARINQLGEGDNVFGAQNGITNTADVLQSDHGYGRTRFLTYTQNGDNNISSIYQGDSSYSGTITQYQRGILHQIGNGNEGIISQVNGPGSALIHQVGNTNKSYIFQNNSTTGSWATIRAEGDGNTANVYQADADGSRAWLVQTGNINSIELSQLNVLGNATITQRGHSNFSYVLQTQPSLKVGILQQGDGGTVNIYN